MVPVTRFRLPHPLGVLATAVVLAGCAADAPAQTSEFKSQHHAYRAVPVVSGLENPWSLAFLPNGDLLVTERPGRLRMVKGGKLEAQPIEGVPEVHAQGQGGLLDVVLHPNFSANRLVYLSYSKPGAEGATTAVIRGRLDGNRLTNVQEVIEMSAWGRGRVHFGSRMVFDRQGYLYVSVGERGEMQRAQDLADHAGSVLRLHDDGRVPADNPFVGREGVAPEIWTYGNRSPQGLAMHPVTGEIWEAEHGPRGGDELNLVKPGANYGWPVITYGINYNGRPISDISEKAGMEQPVHYWVPSIATSGLAIYNGDKFPQWRGDFFVGGLAGLQLARVRVKDGRSVEYEKLLDGYGKRIRDVRSGPDGHLYVLTDDANGAVVRIEPISGR